MVRPDYSGGGFLNLIASIVAGCGGQPRHATLALLPPRELAAARNILFLLIDGLGDNYLRREGRGGALLALRRGAPTSVFPPTTASSVTTSFTGWSPLEHGLTGWFTLFGEAGCVGAPLPFQRRGEKARLGVPPARLFRAGPLFDGLARRSIVVTYRPIVDSVYSLHHSGRAERLAYDNLAGLVAQAAAAVRSGPEPKLVYAYWPEFDALSHHHGNSSAEVRAHFRELDAAFGALMAQLAGTETLVVASADHGFVDSEGADALDFADAPGLAALLRYPLCGESRAAFCHVQEGRAPEFIERAQGWLGDRARVCPSGELAAEGWFGPGEPHPRLAERIGDVALVMHGRTTVKDWTPGEPRHRLIGHHGGASEEEMNIPLIVGSA
ncbi:MAG: alkaline phosphatase family protein [Betaproteobacteria bacterium]|nr:alkaline phosphatase family protein [Betaproteobacteria bacterium]MDH5222282.1 alkaline phosphatase family protein [Betaproteobacteria bacterium]MDH5351739.1 alkaline phosphatase family protein [Betaproteobacteria bacterium]